MRARGPAALHVHAGVARGDRWSPRPGSGGVAPPGLGGPLEQRGTRVGLDPARAYPQPHPRHQATETFWLKPETDAGDGRPAPGVGAPRLVGPTAGPRCSATASPCFFCTRAAGRGIWQCACFVGSTSGGYGRIWKRLAGIMARGVSMSGLVAQLLNQRATTRALQMPGRPRHRAAA